MEYTEKDLADALSYTKVGVFTYDGFGCFLASIMSNTDISWNKEITETACTNGKEIFINPDWFMERDIEQRKATLLHELWHIARLHNFRAEGRHSKYWNVACDIVINNDLQDKGFDIKSMHGFVDKRYTGHAEEGIYEIVREEDPEQEDEDYGSESTDLLPPPDGQDMNAAIGEALQKIMQADEMAKAANQKGFEDMCGLEAGDGTSNELANIMNEFLHPKIKWYILLRNFLKDVSTHPKRTWIKRNRRYPDIYLPGTKRKKNRLDHLIYFLDISGSITPEQVKRFNSEVRYIKELFNPKLLTLVQFDTEICRIDEFTDRDKFTNIHVVDGGGTSYKPVHDFIQEKHPTCSIIFTDLYCDPMEPVDTPVIWVAVDTDKTEVPFGKLISITSEDLND